MGPPVGVTGTESGDGKQVGQQRNQSDTDEGDTAACHQLLDALGFCLCVIKKQ